MIGKKVSHRGREFELTLERDVVFRFLEELRNSGVTNMFGGAPYIASTFGCSRPESTYWLVEWFNSFGNE